MSRESRKKETLCPNYSDCRKVVYKRVDESFSTFTNFIKFDKKSIRSFVFYRTNVYLVTNPTPFTKIKTEFPLDVLGVRYVDGSLNQPSCLNVDVSYV